MDSYIIRIYRRSGRKAHILVGTVEGAGIDKKVAFLNAEDLWEILKRRKRQGEWKRGKSPMPKAMSRCE
jgi:hypothetical protein